MENKQKIKNTAIKNLKIGGALLKVGYYYLLAGTISFGSIKIYENYLKENMQYENIKTELYSNAETEYIHQYEDFDDNVDKLSYYSKWNRNDDGSYSREIVNLYLEEEDKADIEKKFESGNISLSDFNLSSATNEKETSALLSDEEINSDAYYKAELYSKNEDKYILVNDSEIFHKLLSVSLALSAYYVFDLFLAQFEAGNIGKCRKRIKEIKENNKSVAIRNKEIVIEMLKTGAYYLLAGAISFGSIEHYAYFLEENIQYENIKTELYSNAETEYIHQYENFDDNEDKLSYYSKWNRNDDGSYSREIINRYIGEEEKANVEKNFESGNISLSDFNLSQVTIEKETSTLLSDEEINSDAYYKAELYSKSKDNYIPAEDSKEFYESCVIAAVLDVMFIYYLLDNSIALEGYGNIGKCKEKIKEIKAKY